MGKRLDFLVGAMLLVIVFVSLAACATTSPPATGNTPSATTAKQCPPAPAHCDLIWSGGPVQHHPTAYAIFWGQQWEDQPYYAAAVKVSSYLHQVGGTSYANILSQYADAQGPISNQLKADRIWIDDRTDNLLLVTSTTCHGKTLTESALKDEINFAMIANGWPENDPDSTYLIYTPPGYAVDTEGAPDDAVSPCSNAPKGYCGYHQFNTTLNSFRVYAAIVYPTGTCSLKGLPVPVSAQNDIGQTLVEVTAHEQFEAATDPDPNPGTIGWQDVTGGTGEMSDKCAWKFPPGGLTQLGSDLFAVPLQWSNATHSCVNSYMTPAGQCRTPQITSVSAFAAGPSQNVLIEGTCFGTNTAFSSADSPYFRISITPSSASLSSEWNACSTDDAPADFVTCSVSSWTDTAITFTGFTGSYGQNGWVVNAGGTLAIQVWNPQTGQGPGTCTVVAGSTGTTHCTSNG